jgi:hypothetical protein
MRLINLIPLQEIDFPNQRAFDQYNKVHKLRPDTKVVVAGRVTTAGRASQNSPTPVKGTSVFGNAQNNPAQSFNTKVSKMTDNNAHSAAAVELAIYMDDKEAVSKLQQIKKYHDNRGYLQPGEAKERGEIVNNLLQRAQKELPKKDFDLVSSAFGGQLPKGEQPSKPTQQPSKVKIGDVNVTKDKQTGIVHLQDTNTYGNRPFTNTSILPKDIPTVIKHLSQPNPIKFRITSVNSIYKDTFVTKSNDGITITNKSKSGWPTVRFKSNELPNLIKYLQQIS